MAHPAFKSGPAYLSVEKPRVIIQKPESKPRLIAIQSVSEAEPIGIFYKMVLILAASCSLISLWLAFKA